MVVPAEAVAYHADEQRAAREDDGAAQYEDGQRAASQGSRPECQREDGKGGECPDCLIDTEEARVQARLLLVDVTAQLCSLGERVAVDVLGLGAPAQYVHM